MRRPLLWALGFLVCGIVIGRAFSPMILFGPSLVLGLILCGILYWRYRYAPVFAFVLFLLVGLIRVTNSLHSHIDAPVHVEFHGTVLDVGRTGSGNQRAIVRGSDFRVMAYIRPHQPQVVLGQEVVLTGYLLPLSGPRNPGGYDQFQHLRAQKVDATIWPEDIALGRVRPSLVVSLRHFRDGLADVFDSILPPQEAGVIKSMVLGDRLDMDRDLAFQYRTMGIFHILSISGMHVTILTMVVFGVLKLFLEERHAGLVALVIMILYCLMTGAAVSTVRAVTMGGVLVFGRVLYRDYDMLTSVSLAGVALLIYEPLYMFNVGFQLSFGAVFGIGILKTPIERLLSMLRLPSGKTRESIAVGMSASFTSYVVFAYHFYEIPIYSVIGNLVIMPTVTALLVLGALTALSGLVWMPVATVLAGPVYFILQFYNLTSRFFYSLPGAMTLTGGGYLPVALAGVAILLTFAYAFAGFGEDFRRRLVLFFGAVLVLIMCLFVRDFVFDMRVTALDTHGSYVVIRNRGEMLVVGSGRGGEAVLLRYMDMRGVRRAHGLVLTEPPRTVDIRRIEALLPRFQVLYLPYGLVLMDELRLSAAMYGVELVWLENENVLAMGQLTAQAVSQPGMRQDLQINFRSTAIDITLDGQRIGPNANIIIGGGGIVLGDRFYSHEYYGAVWLRANGRRIRYYSF